MDGCYYPTWRLVDGACRESLAFEVARKEGVPSDVVDRAEELCVTKMLYPDGLRAAHQEDRNALEKEVKRSDDDRYEQLFNLCHLTFSVHPAKFYIVFISNAFVISSLNSVF